MPTTFERVRGAALTATNLSPRISRLYNGTDKLDHGFLQYYRRHFASLRLRRLVVFEIGVGGYISRVPGGSLPLWRDYFPRSTIVGLDLHAKDIDFGPQVHFVQADQSRPEDLQGAVTRFGRPDIVIDDGSHIGEHIICSYQTLWPQLAPGGWYVIEDLISSYLPDFGGSHPPGPATGIGLIRSLIDSVQSRDPTFDFQPELGTPGLSRSDVAAVYCYPGITFIEKAADA
jgi:hypothetical protein